MGKYTHDIVNEMQLTGRIISETKKDNGSSVITVITKSGKKDAYIRIWCPAGMLPEHKNRAHVSIKGHLNAFFHENADKKFFQQFAADEIVVQETLTEKYYDLKGKFFPEPDCNIFIKGVVKAMYDAGEYIRFIVSISNNPKRVKNVSINMKRPDRMPKINPGDTICTVCGISTPKKVIDDKEVAFENITIMDIAVEK